MSALLAHKDSLDCFLGQLLAIDCHHIVNAIRNAASNAHFRNSLHSEQIPVMIQILAAALPIFLLNYLRGLFRGLARAIRGE